MKIKNNFIARLGSSNTVGIIKATTGRLIRKILAQVKVYNLSNSVDKSCRLV